MTTTLLERPERTQAAEEQDSAGMERQVVALHLGEESYGIDIAAIHSVLTPQPITSLPNVPSYVRGVMNLRGRILPVIDLRARFGLPPLPDDQQKSARIIIVETGGAAVGLIVDSVSEVLRLSQSAIEPPSALLAGADLRCLLGIGRIPDRAKSEAGERLLLLLDIDQILRLEELAPRNQEPPMSSPIKVLVVDDSAFMRKMISEILIRDPSLCIVGTARDGADALVKFDALRPDLVTLDVEMPVLDGFGTLTEIMHRRPTPVVMVSSLTQSGADATLRCLELGAVDFIGKPSGAISLDIEKIAGDLIAKVKTAAGAKVLSRLAEARHPSLEGKGLEKREKTLPFEGRVASLRAGIGFSVLVIGASTGGPRALQTLVPALPADFPLPIVIVQHMPPGFTASLARRLEQTSPFAVREAADGDRLQPGQILVAPGGRHLKFDADGTARLTEEPPVHGVRPSVDVTLASLAALHGPRMIAALLTGMGRDGARGLKMVSDLGGRTLAEDETTCVVYGMPKAAAEMGGVGCLLPLPEIAPALARLCAEH